MSILFVDVDTQLDFLFPAGALYVPGAEQIVAGLGRLQAHAMAKGIAVLSTLDTHAEDDPEFRQYHFPSHCVRGTFGWHKPKSLVSGAATTIEPGPFSGVAAGPQLIVVKHSLDCFTNPVLDPLVASLRPAQIVVYGVVTEICVRYAALGLLDRGYRVAMVSDAVRSLDQNAAASYLSDFAARGGTLTTVAAVCG